MDENLQEWNLLKIIAPSVTFLGILFYFIPISRSYFRKGCLILIDGIALGLKTILNSLEPDYSSKSYNLKREALKTRKEKRKKEGKSTKNHYKGAEINREWSEVRLYPTRGFHQFSGEFVGDFKGNKSMMSKKNDILYLENEGMPSNEDQYFPGISEDVKNSRKSKKRKNKEKFDIYRAEEDFDEEQEDDQEVKDKLRKIRRKIISLTDGSKKERQQKEFEALKLIDDLINEDNINVGHKRMEFETLVVDGNKVNGGNDGSWSGRKPPSARRESARRSRRSTREEISPVDYEDIYSDDSDDFLPPPIINGKFTF
ncbi:uncharacterized protein DDB_G0283697-like [Cotesia glomerata]|uniref:Uncharacterized protein n=1 Tax=Cotesia glomerata TaxID=32391 RepID=A0AAV7HZ14_COTGL|nr:uncharacterized protein DDB_G0283697-like [Cotesia glomerata]KAH0535612.1 hypothetical protein KQX54_017664 [Cotesia glomerata]